MNEYENTVTALLNGNYYPIESYIEQVRTFVMDSYGEMDFEDSKIIRAAQHLDTLKKLVAAQNRTVPAKGFVPTGDTAELSENTAANEIDGTTAAVMSTPAALQTIEIENYTEPDENRRVKHIGNKTFGEVFKMLENHLKKVGLLPSEYFLMNDKIADTEIPENWREFICSTNFGGSEGIYLDISLTTSDNKHINFATGKTLDEDVEAFINMSRIGAECSMMLNGNGAEIRYRQIISAEKNIADENIIENPQPNGEQPQESDTLVTQLAAIESTEDYQESRFNTDLIDTDTKNGDGTYGKVQEKYRIVTVQSNILSAYNNEVYNSFEEAEKALDNISELKKVSYDEIVNYVGLERAKETMSYEQNDVKSSELENKDSLNVNIPKKIPNTISHKIFKGLCERFPEIMNKSHSHEHYESTGYEPLSVEWIGGNSLSLMQYYSQYGDIMCDPDIVLNIDFENETANAVSYENSGLGIYNEYDIGSAMQKDCNSFMLDWINQLEHMHHHITRATVEHKYNGDTYDIDLNFKDGKVISVDGDEAAAADYIQNNNIEIYSPAPITEIGKPNDFQIGDIILYEGRAWTIDNLDFDDNEMIYITANDNSGDERAFYHDEIVSFLEKGGFHFTDVNQEELEHGNIMPVYPKTIKEAIEADERELYFSDRKENEMCKRSIDYAVTCNYVNMRFKSEKVMLELLSRYSAERIANLIAARVVDAGKWDKRYSQKNIEWANDFLSDYSADDLEKKFHSYLNAHPILLNDIADRLRENLDKYIEKQQSKGNENTYSIYQVKKGIDYLSKRFVSYDELPDQPNIADYDLVYQGRLNDFGKNKLDEIFRKFNIDIPADYKGHSLSVSDVIILNGNEAHFVDSVGFKDIPDFFVERNERTQPVNNAAFNSEQESKYKSKSAEK